MGINYNPMQQFITIILCFFVGTILASNGRHLLVAFIGQQRDWKSTWKSQSMYLNNEFKNKSWSSIACLDTNDPGLNIGSLKWLRTSRIRRVGNSAWWGDFDHYSHAYYCETGIKESKSMDWVKLNTNNMNSNNTIYYYNIKSQQSMWTLPFALSDEYKTSLAHGKNITLEEKSATELASCFLRRLTACRDTILDECMRQKCSGILMMRPDLEISKNILQGKLRNIFNEQSNQAIYGRFRCVGSDETPRTKVFPAQICQGFKDTKVPCPHSMFTLDDQVAYIPSQFADSFFRKSYFPPPENPSDSLACPHTSKWPEGVLTHTLLKTGIPVKELSGFQTITKSSSHGKVDKHQYDF